MRSLTFERGGLGWEKGKGKEEGGRRGRVERKIHFLWPVAFDHRRVLPSVVRQ